MQKKHIRIIRIQKKGPWYRQEWEWNKVTHMPIYKTVHIEPVRWKVFYTDGTRDNPYITVFANDELGAMVEFYKAMEKRGKI